MKTETRVLTQGSLFWGVFLVFVVLLLAGPFTHPVFGQCNVEYKWYNGNINVTGQTYNITARRVTYGHGYFIAVCDNALIYRSSDGINWTDISPSGYLSTQHFFGIAYDSVNNVFVVAGRDGLIIRSVDYGDNWMTAYTTGLTDDLLFAVYGNSVVLVISEGGQVYRSTDGGSNWSNYTWNPIGQRPRSVTFAQGVFAAGGYEGAIFYSSSGLSWTQVSSGSTMRIRGIAYSPGLDLWVAGGYHVCTSKDLNNWTYRFSIADKFSLPDQAYCGGAGDNFALLAGEHGMMLMTADPNGEVWTSRTSGSGGYILDTANLPDGSMLVNVGSTAYDRTPADEWHYPFRYNPVSCINPNTSPIYVTIGGSVVGEVDAEYIPMGSSDDLRAEAHLRKDSLGRLWASLHMFGLYYSNDGGITWSFKANNIITQDKYAYSYFTILNDDTFLLGKVKDGWTDPLERTPILFYRSTDYGDTWQQCGSISAAPYEGISEGTQNLTQLPDGKILYPVTRYDWEPDPEEPDAVRENVIFRSTDGGYTWGDKSYTYTTGTSNYVWEPHVIKLQSGKLLGVFRYQRRVQATDTEAAVTAAGGNWSCCTDGRNKSIFNQLYIGESNDNGYTWVNLHDIRDSSGNLLLFWGDPHGTLLQVPDGRVILVYDHRYDIGANCTALNSWQVANRAVVSSDEGATWGPEIYHISYGKGYPSSVVLNDGTIVTVTGSYFEDSTPFTAMAVRWRLEDVPVTPSITITSPNGGEDWELGSTHIITWNAANLSNNVKITLWQNDIKVGNIASSVPNSPGSYTWTVGQYEGGTATAGTGFKIKIKEILTVVADWSDDYFTISAPPPTCGENWQTVYETDLLNEIAFGNSTFTAVGESGIVQTSTDGISWTQRTSGTTNSLKGVVYGNSLFVAVGYSGKIITSTNGISWTSQASGTTQRLRGVTYGNGLYVTVGDNGTILTSTNGTTWTARTSGTANRLWDVEYGNSGFVAVGAIGTALSSSDGITWTLRTSTISDDIWSVTSSSSLYVAVAFNGKIITSTNGTTWTQRSSGTTGNLYAVDYDSSTYVAVGESGIILRSTNGTTWTAQASGTTELLLGVGFGNSRFVAVGTDALLYSLCY